MNKLFGKKDVKGNFRVFQEFLCQFLFILFFLEELKAQNKVLRSAQRDIDRDKNQLEREMKKLVKYLIQNKKKSF